MKLMRLPNVFTAMSDVAMGFVFVQPVATQPDAWSLGFLMATSGLLYIAGVVFNDVFDVDLDRVERPERPLASGRMPVRAASRVGWKAILLSMFSCGGAAILLGHVRPLVVTMLLVILILWYDAKLKRTVFGPLAMGACRMFNVILGMCAVDLPLQSVHWVVAGGLGVYVVGVTLFARTENQRSNRLHLFMATLIMMFGIALLGSFPSWSRETLVIPLLQEQPERFHWLLGILGMLIACRCLRAVVQPTPVQVRIAVTQSILSIVILDASVSYAVRGIACGVLVVSLIVPAMFLGRWIDAT
jgi:4-hydroxybenzoate polyprenyltransferase